MLFINNSPFYNLIMLFIYNYNFNKLKCKKRKIILLKSDLSQEIAVYIGLR